MFIFMQPYNSSAQPDPAGSTPRMGRRRREPFQPPLQPPPALPDLLHLEKNFFFNLASFGHFLHKPPGPGHLLGCPSPREDLSSLGTFQTPLGNGDLNTMFAPRKSGLTLHGKYNVPARSNLGSGHPLRLFYR